MNFHTEIYKCIAHDRLAQLKKETYENECFYKKAGLTEWKMKKDLFQSRILRRWKAG